MSFEWNPDTIASVNESAVTPLLEGENVYKCIKTQWDQRKDSSGGLTNEWTLGLTLQANDGVNRQVFLPLTNPNEITRNIALSTLKGFWDAAGLSGTITPDRFPQLTGRFYRIVAKAKAGRSADGSQRTYVNIRSVHKADESAWTASVVTSPAPEPAFQATPSTIPPAPVAPTTAAAVPWG